MVQQFLMLAMKLNIRIFTQRADKKDIERLLSMVTPRILTLPVAPREMLSICREGDGRCFVI